MVARGIVIRVVLDVLCLLIVGVPVVYFFFAGKAYKRGFFCDDESIQYPYKDSTISSPVLFVVGGGVPIITMVIVEVVSYVKRSKASTYGPPMRHKVHPIIFYLYKYIGTFLFVVVANQFLTDVVKYNIGRLRPHFLDVCKPDYSKFNCSDGYITEDVCTVTTGYIVKNSRLSFVSGHASVAMATMLYASIYLEARFRWRQVTLVRPMLQVMLMSAAFYTCCSRVSDYKHHWSDVLAGAILGITMCLVLSEAVGGLLSECRAQSGRLFRAKTEEMSLADTTPSSARDHPIA